MDDISCNVPLVSLAFSKFHRTASALKSVPSWNFTSFLNLGASPIAIKMGTTDPGAPVFPTDGTNGDFVLPPVMTSPMVIASPSTPYYLTAKSSSGTAGLLYVTPAADQS